MIRILFALNIAFFSVSVASADEALERYFAGLRDRQLYFVAESFGLGRLAETNLLDAERITLAVELSRTYCHHATTVLDAERSTYWQQATQVLERVRDTLPQHPRLIELDVQDAMVPVSRVEFLTHQLALYPNNRKLRSQVATTAESAIEKLTSVEDRLNRIKPQPDSVDAFDLWELKSLRQSVWLALGTTWQHHADVTDAAGSRSQSAKWLEACAREKADVELPARARVAWAGQLREQGEWNRAERLLQTVAESHPSAEIADSVLVERVRLLLAEGKAPDAAELLQKHRQRVSQVSGELSFWHVHTLAELRRITVEKGQPAETQQLERLIRDAVERTDVLIGGYWAARSHRVWKNIQSDIQYGPEISKIVRHAEAAVAEADWSLAQKRYESAIEKAIERNRREVIFELSDTRASLLIRQGKYAIAAEGLATLVMEFPDQPRTAELDLLRAICLGKVYQQQPTSANRETYSMTLQTHLKKFPQSPTTAEARWMLGSLQEARLQHTEALNYYEAIPLEHPRGPFSRTAAARCQFKIVRWLETLERREQDASRKQAIVEKRAEWERRAIQQLTQWMTPFPETATDQNAWQAEIAVWLARLNLERNPPRFAAAEDALAKVVRAESQSSTKSNRWQQVVDLAVVERIHAFAGRQRFSDALAVANAIPQIEPKRRLELLRQLQKLEVEAEDSTQRQWGKLLLSIAEPLEDARETLDQTDLQTIDLALAQALTLVGQSERAAKIYSRLTAKGMVDPEVMAAAARNLNRETDAESLARAQTYWQRVEKMTQPGTDAWFAARFHNLELMLRTGNVAEFRKLMQVTTILHPQLGGPKWRSKFQQLEKQAPRKSR
ncbi:tetratricopeptide repeat protein [Thalassoroseus pseudoceratinae]|uniref:tetratricopeptide repeat protein n=1 Tax=Thalassoroseus pseudoceratinae TaxID=2713176 RepID=UPI0014235763|nr:tetratricopeptide repeat protein [Thalassoroseus pseudoceratinae]